MFDDVVERKEQELIKFLKEEWVKRDCIFYNNEMCMLGPLEISIPSDNEENIVTTYFCIYDDHEECPNYEPAPKRFEIN